jgi:hypothetical protein
MRLLHSVAAGLLALMLGPLVARAEPPASPPAKAEHGGQPASPLRFVPEQADFLVEVRQPRRLVQTLTTLDTLKQLQQFAPVRELLDSTNARRSRQLIAYFEKELGAPWPQLLERLAGRGAVLGLVIQPLHKDTAEFGVTSTPLLLVVQGDDAKLMGRFFRLGLQVFEQELARQEAKEKPVKVPYEGIETVRVGTEFHAAVAGGALLVSNTEKMLHAGLDRYLGRTKKSMADAAGLADAARLLPADPLASFWLNMETVRKAPQAKAVYKSPPRDDPQLTVLFGHYLDLLGRSPFVCAGVYPKKDGFLAAIRLPRGRDGMGEDRLLHVPPGGMPGSRPLLEPKNVLYSESNYLDIARIWTDRTKLFNEKQVQGIEKSDKQTPFFLAGVKISKLLPHMGPYYRLVAVHQEKNSYKKTPKIAIPAFAVVWELREPEAFNKSVDPILRGIALLAGAQANLKLTEEDCKGCKLVGYRFPEEGTLKGDVNDLRYNFSPCFTRVGDEFVAASTIELGRELVDLLQKEGTSPSRGGDSTGSMRLYGSGAAAHLQTIEGLLITQTALDQAVSPKEAREQVRMFLDMVRRFGALSLGPVVQEETTRYDIRLRPENEPRTGDASPKRP